MKVISDENLIQLGIFLATALGFGLAYIQLRASRKITQGEFLLHLDEMLREHAQVHAYLRPEGKWQNSGPKNDEEWIAVEMYMGLLERCKVLIDSRIIGIAEFDELYGYRVANIVQNDCICCEKLVKRGMYWKNFIELWRSLKQHNLSKYKYENCLDQPDKCHDINCGSEP